MSDAAKKFEDIANEEAEGQENELHSNSTSDSTENEAIVLNLTDHESQSDSQLDSDPQNQLSLNDGSTASKGPQDQYVEEQGEYQDYPQDQYVEEQGEYQDYPQDQYVEEQGEYQDYPQDQYVEEQGEYQALPQDQYTEDVDEGGDSSFVENHEGSWEPTRHVNYSPNLAQSSSEGNEESHWESQEISDESPAEYSDPNIQTQKKSIFSPIVSFVSNFKFASFKREKKPSGLSVAGYELDTLGPPISDMPTANFNPRFFATVIDIAFYIFLGNIVDSMVSFLGVDLESDSNMIYALNWMIRVFLQFIVIYFPILMYGQTLGKFIFGLKIVNLDNTEDLSFHKIFFREFIGKIISTVPLGFGYQAIKSREDHLAWHDRLAKTRVVYTRFNKKKKHKKRSKR